METPAIRAEVGQPATSWVTTLSHNSEHPADWSLAPNWSFVVFENVHSLTVTAQDIFRNGFRWKCFVLNMDIIEVGTWLN